MRNVPEYLLPHYAVSSLRKVSHFERVSIRTHVFVHAYRTCILISDGSLIKPPSVYAVDRHGYGGALLYHCYRRCSGRRVRARSYRVRFERVRFFTDC